MLPDFFHNVSNGFYWFQQFIENFGGSPLNELRKGFFENVYTNEKSQHHPKRKVVKTKPDDTEYHVYSHMCHCLSLGVSRSAKIQAVEVYGCFQK